MSLSCGCDGDWDGEGWAYRGDRETTLQTPRRRRCCSCKKMVDVGAACVEFSRFRLARSDWDVEIKIYGEDGEIALAPRYMCEGCGDLYFSLEEIGYCVSPDKNMRELVAEHVARKVAEAGKHGV